MAAREVCEEKSGFCYSDVSSSNPNIHETQFTNQIQGFVSSNPEMFNLTTGMEMIGFSKNLQQQQSSTTTSDNNNNTNNNNNNNTAAAAAIWKGFFANKSGNTTVGPSSSKSDFYHHQFNIKQQQHHDFTATGISETTTSDQNLMETSAGAAATWEQQNRFLVDDDSSLRCVFPCEGNERPSQGLSLSLSSTDPSTIGLQSFELRHTAAATTSNNHHHHNQDVFFAKSSSPNLHQIQASNHHHHFQQQLHGGSVHPHPHHNHFHLRNSKYLVPAQELLNEFCSLGIKQTDLMQKQKQQIKNKQWEEDNDNGNNNGGGSSSRKQSLYSVEFMELQKRKTKLLSMLEEVERRYKHYCDQMKAVVSSFEAVAGSGAATVYSALASKAMSRHFRCLKDGIVNQIQATRKAMGEKDPVAPGTTRGETPRLRVLDQTLRQHRAFQQMSMMESHPWRPQRGLPERSVSVSNWFINARVRLWKPMIEEMYTEETKEHDISNNNNMAISSDGFTMDLGDNGRHNHRNNPPSTSTRPEDQKPTPDQLVRIDSECLSSIITNTDKNDSARSSKTFQNHHIQNFGRVSDSFGTMELDFSSYNHHSNGGTLSFGNENPNHSFNGGVGGGGGGGGGGVSLTLGLQQHGGSGVSLAFSPASQSSLFYPRDHIDECQPVQYSLLDGEAQNLPYRNLMGAQLLHDLAG
ncbi:hypothetical protein FEM48_Zijuj11G0030900 [Ziziphus jujuba var. spinosa]|uniref:POX domain-containing protein n=1 Tax=Ziziphus jujuba var. spinosa TaxID=714518 RepID=A0A978UGG2_ZIZJJ|nr:hypothetical protein FEM48_Zijuj11G0030900 [Ziziphus jujuba var. spinosa]